MVQRARSEEDRDAMERKEHVVKHILDQSCPRCHTGFDFVGGCFALACEEKYCDAAFCGYCIHISAEGDSHTHTAGCEFGFGLFGGVDNGSYAAQIRNFANAQKRRRMRGLRLYMGTLLPAHRRRLLDDLAAQLRDYDLMNEFLPV
jgi:hypothetical protein